MNLPFKTHWANGTPTYFIPKIWKSIWDEHSSKFFQYTNEENYNFLVNDLKNHYPKHHTIRKGNSWRAGDKIHFCINNRSKKYFRFAPVIEVVSVQDIEIIHKHTKVEILIDGEPLGEVFKFDKSFLGEIETLVKNDGFENIDSFIAFFVPNEGDIFKGQIIHWTDLRY